MAKLGFEVEQLKNKSSESLRVTVPAVPSKYSAYAVDASVSLPAAYQNAICLKIENNNITLINTTDKLTVAAYSNERVILLAPIYRLQDVDITAELDKTKLDKIDADIARLEQEEKERAEQKASEPLVYKYLAKYLTDNWLESVREKSYDKKLNNQGVKAQVNQNGLQALLDKPFERNEDGSYRVINPDAYADAKTAMLNELERIKKGEVDLNATKDFEIIKYDYKDIL